MYTQSQLNLLELVFSEEKVHGVLHIHWKRY